MVDQKLINYVSSAVKSGRSPDDIKRELVNLGWPENDVNQAIGLVQKGFKEPEKPKVKERPAEEKPKEKKPKAEPERGHRNIYIIGLVVIVLILAVTTYFLSTWGAIELTAARQGKLETCGNGVCDFGEDPVNCPEDCVGTQPGPLKVSASPLTQNASAGENFTVEIKVKNATDLYAFQFDIEYNPDVLKYESIEEGGFLSRNGADTTYPLDLVLSSGHIKNIVSTRLGKVGGVNGEGTLEIITFTALSAGTSQITISNIKFVNSKPQEIEANNENGQVIVS
ncbi:MAG: hypothetical protein GTN76_14275 [Candidatus Aenigmarchaeota archaeon]|nr:hypothetical protein [Candidatus Aenigmarchaeota archaeon]